MAGARFWEGLIDHGRYGRITFPARYGSTSREVLAYCQRIFRTTRQELERYFDWNLERLDCFFLDKRVTNAVVVRHRNRHAMGICVGLIFTVKRNLDRAMKNREFLAEYLTPVERSEWSWRFLGMIAEHVYLHEVAHAVRGHLAYHGLTAEHGAIDEGNHSLNRYLELDADLHALDMWLTITEDAADFPTREVLLLDLYFHRVLTLLLLYQALDAENLTIQAHVTREHPPPIHRALLLTAAMQQTMPERYGLTREAIENVHHQAWWEASIAARTSRLVEDRWWGGVSGRRRGIAALRRTLRHFEEHVEPELDAFAASLPDNIL